MLRWFGAPAALRPACLVIVFQAIAFGQPAHYAFSAALTASPNPANYGQPVTLTASLNAGATGNVTFYDGVTILGVAPISGNQTTLTTIMLPSGKRSLRAFYPGGSPYVPSSTPVVQETVVAGQSLGFKQSATYGANFMLQDVATGDFNGDGKLDIVAGNANAFNILVFLGNGDGSFQTAVSYPLPFFPGSIVVGDFDGDGRPDLAVAAGAYVSLLKGNGDGTFQSAVNGSYGTNGVLAVGDFNNDGKADLAVANNNTYRVGILLGGGDGTFTTGADYAFTGGYCGTLTVADFNSDGNADLAVSSGNIITYLGNGDGTFQSGVVAAANSSSYEISVGDFDGDGKPDLAASISNLETMQVLLGNGAGGFGSPASYATNNYGALVAVEDFNGDGNADVVVGSGAGYYTDLFLGKGDGAFQPKVSYPSDESLRSMAVGDFNGDGRPDLILVPMLGVDVLLGNAIPDLTVAVSYGGGLTQGQTGAAYTATVSNVGDFTTSGPVSVAVTLPSVLSATGIGGGGWSCTLATLICTRSEALAAGSSYPPITITMNVALAPTGNATAVLTVSGGGDQNPANNAISDTAFIRYSTTATLTSAPNPAGLGQTITLTATVTSGATGRVSFYNGVAFLGDATLSGGTAVVNTASLPSGAATLRAMYGGDSNYGPSVSAPLAQTITPTSETGAMPYTSYGVQPYPGGIVAADFNGDGKVDLLTVNSQGTVSALLSKGDGTFRVVNSASNITSSLAVAGDFNNDGKQDVIVYGFNEAYTLLGNGDGTFQAGPAWNASGVYYSLAAADFNGDGKLDLAAIVAGATGFGAQILLGNGDGTFQPGVTLASGASYLAVADMNGDGKPDLVLLGSGSETESVSVLLGNGDGTFQPAVTAAGSIANPNALVVGDFNGDGKPDVAVVYWVAAQVFLGNGDGTLRPSLTSSLGGVPGYFALAGDFNGDGKLDIAYTAYTGSYVYIAFGNGDGTFQSSITVGTEAQPDALAQGDFNGDGIPDFAAVIPGASAVDVFLGGQSTGLSISASHSGNFTAGGSGVYRIVVGSALFAGSSGTATVTDTLPAGFAATAISGSGWACTLSSLTCTRSGSLTDGTTYPAITVSVTVPASPAPATVTNQASVSSGGTVSTATDATRVVAPSTTTLTVTPNPSILGQFVTLTATPDEGATGTVEFTAADMPFAVGMPLGSAPVSGGQATFRTRLLPAGVQSLSAIYSGDSSYSGGIAVTQQTVNVVRASGFTSAGPFSSTPYPMEISTADFNGDGATDLVTLTSSGNTNGFSVLLGDGKGGFGARTDYSLETPMGMVTADFNGDGNTDIAVVAEQSDIVSVFLGNGDGSFRTPIPVASGSYVSSVAVGDFNGDGKPDLVVETGGGASILFGNGDGTFQLPVAVTNISAGLVSDFNNDGKADVAWPNGPVVSVALGNGDGTFQAPVGAAVPSSFGAIAVGDLNGDGIPDLVEAASRTGVYVLLGKGDGTFQPYQSYSTLSTCYSVTTADVNGDGKLDVVATDHYRVEILYGHGDGTLQAAVGQAAGSVPYVVAAGDFNGDGRTDLAVANESSTNNITVLLGVYPSSLGVASSHLGRFAVGESGAAYTIGVANAGPNPTSAAVTVVDTLPAGLAATAISGSGWNCALATLTCTRADALAAGSSYPAITLTVNVTASSPGSVTNHVSVLGGGSPAAAGNDLTSIDATYSYLVGDVAPYTSAMAPNFGDGMLNILDLIQELFAVNAVPGFVPAACTDRLDAMDAYPPDTATTRGGDGALDIRDLILELFRVNNLDTSRPVRTSLRATCGAGGNSVGPTATARRPTPRPASQVPAGTLALGHPEPFGEGEERVPVYLEARQDMARVAVTFGLGDGQSPLRFAPTVDTPPSLAQDSQLGMVAVAWLDGVSVRAGERLLLGYIVGPAAFPRNLTLYGLSASGLDDKRAVVLDAPDTSR